jgi:hypothetical protein
LENDRLPVRMLYIRLNKNARSTTPANDIHSSWYSYRVVVAIDVDNIKST